MHTIRLIVAALVCGVAAVVLGIHPAQDWRLVVLMVVCFVAGGFVGELSANELNERETSYFKRTR